MGVTDLARARNRLLAADRAGAGAQAVCAEIVRAFHDLTVFDRCSVMTTDPETLLPSGGVVEGLAMPREEDPYIKAPGFLITGIYPGADPIDLEREFAKPVEDRIAELEDVKRIETSIADGVAVVVDREDTRILLDPLFDEDLRECPLEG